MNGTDGIADAGPAMTLAKLRAHQPGLQHGMVDLIGEAGRASSLTLRQRGILVTACASALGAYRSLAWGTGLSGAAGPDEAVDVLAGEGDWLDQSERALARWARQVTRHPNAIGSRDVQALRDAGYDDGQILAMTVFVAMRIAFATVTDALGARPDPVPVKRPRKPAREPVTVGG